MATSFYTERDEPIAKMLTRTLLETDQEVPDFLQQYIPQGDARENLKFEADSDYAGSDAGGAGEDWGGGGGGADWGTSGGEAAGNDTWGSGGGDAGEQSWNSGGATAGNSNW